MKITSLKQLLLACSILFSSSVFSQNFTITGLSLDSSWVNPCDSSISLSFTPLSTNLFGNANFNFSIQGTTFIPGPVLIAVDWGDGTSNNYTGQAVSPNLPVQFGGIIPNHVYTNPNVSYTMNVVVVNPNNNTYASFTTAVYIGNCSGIVYGSPQVDCNSDGIVDSTIWNTPVPIDFSNTIGTTYSGILINGLVYLPNIPAGTYTFQVNSAWLIANNYTVASTLPTSINITPNGPTTILITLNCGVVPTLTGCTVGQVYCDDNDNGIFDANDSGIAFAPVIVQYNGQSYYGLTDSSGFYSVSYPNPNSSGAIVSINAGWLGQNGYFLPNNSQTTTVTQCSQATYVPMDFAVDCDSSTFTTECVIGWVYCDANTNGILDSGEVTVPYAPVVLIGNGNSITVYTNSNGVFNYSGFNYLGTNAIVSINQNWMVQHGYTYINTVLTTTTNCTSLTPTNFGINCAGNSGCADLWTTVSPWIGYYQNQTNIIKLKWGNYGPASAQSYTLTLTYPAGVTPITSSISNPNYVISGNTITWTFSGSNSFNFSNMDMIYFNVPIGFTNGTQHIFSSTITATGSNSDCYAANNNGSLMMILGNSYDPNDKNVSAQTVINPAVQDELIYTIRFQNTGTAPAQDIYILDTLSSNLDWTTMKMLSASHDMQLIDLGNGIMKFNFPGIWLPDSTANEPLSHGELTYSIKENVGNGIGTQILNTAHIYFDWNPAIVTNTTLNVNNYLGLETFIFNEVKLYPNPTGDFLQVVSDYSIETIVITDMMGKVIFSQKIDNAVSKLDLSTISAGSYLIQMRINDETITKYFVKK